MSNSYFVKVHLVKSVDSDAAAASCLLFLFFWELSQCVVVHVYSPLPSGNKNWTLNLTTCITFLNPTGQTFFEQVILFYFASFLFKSKLWKNWPVENIIWGIVGQTISTQFGTASPLSMFSIIQPLFLQKTKP